MKNLFKSSCLVVALLASVALVGCGGGGGGGHSSNPAAPVNTTSNEATAAKAAVSPVLQNASQILNGGGTNASFRNSTNSNVQQFSINSTNKVIVSAIQTPDFLRAVISEIGGNIDSGLWENESRCYYDIATLTNSIYERTIFDSDDKQVAYIKIEGCSGELSKEGVLNSLSVKSGAKITFDRSEFYAIWGGLGALSFTGKINSDLTIKWEGEKKPFATPIVVDYYGNDITNDSSRIYGGYQTSGKLETKTTYAFSNVIKLSLDKFSHYSYKPNQNFEGKLNIEVNGINDYVDKKTVFYGAKAVHRENGQWIVDQYDWRGYNNIVTHDSKDSIHFTTPVTIALSGNASNFIYDLNSWQPETETIDYKEKYNGTIKDLTLKINKMSGDFDSLVIDNAEVFVEVGDYKTEKVLKIGNQEVTFNNAKIDIKDVKYNHKLYKDFSDLKRQGSFDEYKAKSNEIRNYCFGNAKATFEAEETKNKVTIKGDCDIKAKTINVNMVNNGNSIVKENSPEKVLEFNFKTVDIKGTNADILADNKCEGAVLKVTGIEKDGTKSERTYNVKNGKLVLDTKSQKDKQAPASLPDVKIENIPNELSDSNSIEVAVSEAKPSEELMKDPANESLKVGKKGDLKVASYNKKKTKDSKKIETNISAKNKLIAAVSFYGDNEYTLVFVIDYSDEKHPQIKGSIFQGKRNNVTMDSVENRIAQFAGKDGKLTVITADNTSTVTVQ